MTAVNGRWLIVTDLDGTLLNHHNYDYSAALPAIDVCRSHGIPVILNTSKTFAETIEIRQQLKLDSGFVVENGSCIYLPEDESIPGAQYTHRDGFNEIVCGRAQTEISLILENLETPASCYKRLSKCSVDEAVALTGLSADQAQLAIAREFSEPLIWQGSETELEDFISELDAHGLSTLQGGRFLHIIGQCDKGIAVSKLRTCSSGDARIIALGDSPNDAAMLASADVAMVVSSPSSDSLLALQQADYISQTQAPAGWAECVDHVFKTIIGK